MKHAIIVFLGLMAALTIGMLLWPSPAAQAQSGCQAFHAIVQATLFPATLLTPADVWGGPLYGMLGDELFLAVYSANNGQTSGHGAIGQGRGGMGTVCVGYPSCTDSFSYEIPTSVWPAPPGKGGFGIYNGNNVKIIRGTGRFQYASGNLNESGPFVAWPDVNSPYGVSGRYNAELSGLICGIR